MAIQVKCDMDVYVERANTFAIQMRTIYTANMTHSKSSKCVQNILYNITLANDTVKIDHGTLTPYSELIDMYN